MIIVTWRVLDEKLGGMMSVSQTFPTTSHWEDEQWGYFARYKELPMTIVELNNHGEFVTQWSLELIER